MNLATSVTPDHDLIQTEFSVDAEDFAAETVGTPISIFTTALKNALTAFLQVIDSSWSNGGSALTSSEVGIEFILDDQNQLDFSGSSRNRESNVTHKLKFTIQAVATT